MLNSETDPILVPSVPDYGPASTISLRHRSAMVLVFSNNWPPMHMTYNKESHLALWAVFFRVFTYLSIECGPFSMHSWEWRHATATPGSTLKAQHASCPPAGGQLILATASLLARILQSHNWLNSTSTTPPDGSCSHLVSATSFGSMQAVASTRAVAPSQVRAIGRSPDCSALVWLPLLLSSLRWPLHLPLLPPTPCLQCFKQQHAARSRGFSVPCAALLPEDAGKRAAGALLGAAAAATLLLPAMPAIAVSGGGGKQKGWQSKSDDMSR